MRKTGKRMVAYFLTFIMLLTCVPLAQNEKIKAANDSKEAEREEVRLAPEENCWSYVDCEGGVCLTQYSDFEIMDYDSDSSLPTYQIVVPEYLNGKKVVAFGNEDNNKMFYTQKRITSVILPDSIRSIGHYSFENLHYLERIDMPENLMQIGYGAFEGCSSIQEINIPDSVQKIESGAFYECSSLKHITIPAATVELDETFKPIFFGCSSMEYYEVETGNSEYFTEDGVLYQYTNAWDEDGEIIEGVQGRSIVAYPSAKKNQTFHIGQYTTMSQAVFAGAYNLSSITVDKQNVDYVSIDGVVFGSNMMDLKIFPAGRTGTYQVPDGVEILQYYAFYQTSLSELIISDTVETICVGNFEVCPYLTGITLGKNISEDTVAGSWKMAVSLQKYEVVANNPYLTAQDGILYSKDMKILYDCPNAKAGTVTVPAGVKKIESNAFANCSNIQKIVVPDSVTDVGNDEDGYAFDKDSGYVIYGSSGSVVETVAIELDIAFSSSDNPVPPAEKTENLLTLSGSVLTSNDGSHDTVKDGSYQYDGYLQTMYADTIKSEYPYYKVTFRSDEKLTSDTKVFVFQPFNLEWGGWEENVITVGDAVYDPLTDEYTAYIKVQDICDSLSTGTLQGINISFYNKEPVVTLTGFYQSSGNETSVQPEATVKPTENPASAATLAPTPRATSHPSGSANILSKPTIKKLPTIKKPARVKIKKLKKAGKGCAKVTWGKVKCSDGYQIQYSRTRKFSKKKTETSYSKSTYIFGKSKKTYYVRVRAVNVGWKTQSSYGYKYSKWSKVKKIKLK